MAVGANHLYAAAIRSEKIWLQVQIVVELNGSRVAVLRSQHRELGMIAFKTADVADDTGGTPARGEIGVALRTVCIAGGGQPNCSPMIGVAGSARRRERLRCVMDGAVMARETFLIADLFIEKN